MDSGVTAIFGPAQCFPKAACTFRKINGGSDLARSIFKNSRTSNSTLVTELISTFH